MRTKSCLSFETLKELMIYDPETGIFTRRIQNGPFRPGSVAGTTLNTGYIALIIRGTPYQAHRLAWLYMTGKWPEKWIDHINNNKADNRFCNLRDVSWSVNQHNLKSAKKSNKTGELGVSMRGKKFHAQIQKDKIKYRLGFFDTLEEAKTAFQNKKLELFGSGA